ncbi:MAG TPA: two-component regulator propeller domain-containing protein [Bacteroidia bacterium]|nr:two-component regulator propeller domain-containing protein [Bacteroidia bacterium]
MSRKILISLAFLLSILVNAQTTSFINYSMDQGLVQNQIQSITQDNEGNLFVGTIAGLSKYNGTQWISYTKNTNLAEDWITCSFKDKDGNIWFGHWAGGVTRYNATTQQLENINLEEYTKLKTIRNITQDFTGKLWIATEGAGVFIFDAENKKMFALSKKDGLSSNTVYDICTDENKNMWMATDSGITVVNLNNSVSNPASYTRITNTHGLFSKNITAIKVTSTNVLVIGSADQGAAMVVLQNNVVDWKSYIVKNQILFNEVSGLKSTFIKTIYEDNKKNIWIGTIGGGVSLFINDKKLFNTQALRNGFFKTYSTRQGLNYFNVNAIFQDRENNVWIGTDLGLNQYRGDFMQTFDEVDNLPNNIVWSVFADSDNNIWMGTNNGLAKTSFSYERDGKIENHQLTQYTEKDGLASNVILSSFQDSKGNMWFGTAFNGVSVLLKGATKFKSYTVKDGLANEMVYTIAEDKIGNMWFGTKAGATRFNPTTNEFRNFTETDGLGGNHIYRIFKDSKGLLWIGALGGNLSVYDGASFKKFGEEDGLKQKFILCINEDKNGNLWFGCYGGGLFKYDSKTFTNYTKQQGLKTESPYAITIDNNNNIWIGDNRGVEKFDVKQNKFYHYGKNEGFLGIECNPNAACTDRAGNLWFGTIMGAVRFNLNEETPNTLAPLTKVTGIKIQLEDAPFPADNIFTYKQNNITFKFIGVSLTSPDKIRYEYTLEGFDHGWIPAKSIQEAVYTNLPAGDYVFKVRAYNNNDICSEPVSYTFKVKPPFWQTALFYVLMICVLVFAVFVFDRVRTRNLKIANALLESKVKERTEQLAVKNSELAEKNKNITDSIRYAKYIQDAMLPKQDNLQKLLRNYFVLYKPKDIVSGDFYWLKQQGNFVYIAAVDCTGHGVPGAFLSIEASNLLNTAFNADETKSPATILNKLDKLVEQSLRNKIDDIEIRDGMDLSICKINFETHTVEYAGAFNSIYLVRDNKLIEYDADSIYIGNNDDNKPYTNQTFKIEKEDVLYLFSDGYADQFGGDKGKKYKYHQMQQLLVKNNNKPMDVQKQLLNEEFEQWRGNLEQVDDVMIIGIKIS